MSEMESHVGKLRKVDLQNKTVEEWAKEKLNKNGVTELPSYSESFADHLKYLESYYEKYFFVDDEVYEAFEHTELEDDDMYLMTENEDGTYNFTMRFYNGGTCLSECIEEGIQKLKRKSNEQTN